MKHKMSYREYVNALCDYLCGTVPYELLIVFPIPNWWGMGIRPSTAARRAYRMYYGR